MNIARIIGAGPLIVIDTEVRRRAQVEAGVQLLHVVERGDVDAGVADLAVDVRAHRRVFAVQRDESNAVDRRAAGWPTLR